MRRLRFKKVAQTLLYLPYFISWVILSGIIIDFLDPKGFNIGTYESVFKNPNIFSGFRTSIIVTVVRSLGGTLLTAMTAYPLSKSRLRGGKIMTILILFHHDLLRRHDTKLPAR